MRIYKVAVVTSGGPNQVKSHTQEFTGSQEAARRQGYMWVFMQSPCFVIAIRETYQDINDSPDQSGDDDQLNSCAPGV